MTVAEYMFDFVEKKGCNTVFMVSGSSSMWLTDALCRNEKLKPICCHHEQAAAMAADGYGRVNDVPGVCLVTIGPGATNAITGVAQAYLDSSPMFVFSGQANSKLLEYEIETGIRQKGTQSLNLKPVVSTITKYFAAVMHPEDIRYHMEKAFYEAMTGRKGPVWIDVPVDIQNRQVPNDMIGFNPANNNENICVDWNVIKNEMLSASNPLIIAGNGIKSAHAKEILREFLMKADIPVVTSRGGIDIIETDNKYFVGRPGSYGDRASHFAIQQSDFLLVLGSRLSVSTVGYYPEHLAPNAYKILIDIDKKELEKNDIQFDLKYQMDVRDFLEKLIDIIPEQHHTKWVEHCRMMKEKYPTVLEEYKKQKPISEYYFSKILSDLVKENANIIVDTGSVCNIVSQSWNLKKNQNYLISGGLSCMGFWATAIGTCQKGRQVIAITGDGSAQMNIQELATLKYNQLPIKLFIYNNNGYMLIRHNQHNYMNDRFLGVGPDSGLETPDFCKVSEAYGIRSVKITSDHDISKKINEVLQYEGPIVCEVMVQEFAPIIPKIASRVMPDGSLKATEFDDLFPFLEE